jgi:peroxiredoxin
MMWLVPFGARSIRRQEKCTRNQHRYCVRTRLNSFDEQWSLDVIKDELAAYAVNIIERQAVEQAETLFRGQIGEAGRAADKALRRGQVSPLFALPSATGAIVSLGERLTHGPVIVTFYRGGWCPYCNIALQGLQSRLQEIKSLGGSLIAISPEVPDQSLSTTEKLALEFDVLSDADNFVARLFGLVYRISDAARERLQAFGRDLASHNGTDSWGLPITATYVISQEGLIVFHHVEADYRERLDPTEIVDAVARVKHLQSR